MLLRVVRKYAMTQNSHNVSIANLRCSLTTIQHAAACLLRFAVNTPNNYSQCTVVIVKNVENIWNFIQSDLRMQASFLYAAIARSHALTLYAMIAACFMISRRKLMLKWILSKHCLPNAVPNHRNPLIAQILRMVVRATMRLKIRRSKHCLPNAVPNHGNPLIAQILRMV